jgi:hypothetical protein
LDEEPASWKLWLVCAVKRAKRVAGPIEVLARWARGELDAATARELLRRRVAELVEYYEGFLPMFYLGELDGEGLGKLRER